MQLGRFIDRHYDPYRGVDMDHALSTKAYKGAGMEGFTAKWYASLTRKSMEEFEKLARRVAAQLPQNGRVLEVAPGPGYFAIELAKLGGYQITGLDISRTFVDIARKNAFEAGVKIDFRQGNASQMPFEEATFDFLLCRAAFKNFSDPVPALREMYRVLKPGGRALIIDLRKDAPQESINEAVEHMHLGAVNSVITKLTFRFMLLKRAYTKGDFDRMVAQTRFGSAAIRENIVEMEIALDKPKAA
jgi:ubiquinone/menaquinone biosynthesis C-methylase UbiE